MDMFSNPDLKAQKVSQQKKNLNYSTLQIILKAHMILYFIQAKDIYANQCPLHSLKSLTQTDVHYH